MDRIQAVQDYSEGLNARIQYDLCSTKDDMYVYVTYLDITSLRAISHIPEKSHFPNLGISLSHEDFTTGLVHITINAIQYKVTTPEEQDLVNFTKK